MARRAKSRHRPVAATAVEPTSALLLRAALAEFDRRGFAGTDSNKIARRAGFAPQTFYRWFEDKTDIFIHVYRSWIADEVKAVAALNASNAPAARLVETCVDHHRAHLRFRRDLKQLSLEHPKIRAARADSRRQQIELIQGWRTQQPLAAADIAVALLELERLADALAEDEFADMQVGDTAARDALAAIIDWLRGHRDASHSTPAPAARRRSPGP